MSPLILIDELQCGSHVGDVNSEAEVVCSVNIALTPGGTRHPSPRQSVQRFTSAETLLAT